jgi:CheY-like chemotaxis protein
MALAAYVPLVAVVLVVEDEPSILQLVVQVLADEGHRVRQARNGTEAFAELESPRPDLILLDLMMPVMDGWAFVEHCRQLPDCASIPIIVMSATSVANRARELDVDGWLPKPFELPVLVETVRGALNGRSGLQV